MPSTIVLQEDHLQVRNKDDYLMFRVVCMLHIVLLLFSIVLPIIYVMHFYWAVTPQRQSIVDGMRTIALQLQFGVCHNQIFERQSLFPLFF